MLFSLDPIGIHKSPQKVGFLGKISIFRRGYSRSNTTIKIRALETLSQPIRAGFEAGACFETPAFGCKPANKSFCTEPQGGRVDKMDEKSGNPIEPFYF